MTRDLIEMFKKYEYHDASCFGHALEGNLHLVFSQGFRTEAEVERYSLMMEELCTIVAEKYGGSLKAEHGTGRNVAPFVEMEWGKKATDLMWCVRLAVVCPYFLLRCSPPSGSQRRVCGIRSPCVRTPACSSLSVDCSPRPPPR
jgi:hypothetical protein